MGPRDINTTSADNYTTFILACEAGHADIVKLLLEHGCDTTRVSLARSARVREARRRTWWTLFVDLSGTPNQAWTTYGLYYLARRESVGAE